MNFENKYDSWLDEDELNDAYKGNRSKRLKTSDKGMNSKKKKSLRKLSSKRFLAEVFYSDRAYDNED